MKKYLAVALGLSLTGAAIVANAQRGPGMDPAAMQAMHQEMQQKMSATTTDQERQALMAEHRKSMQEKFGTMQPGMPGMGHASHAMGAMAGPHGGHDSMPHHMGMMHGMPDHAAH